MNFSWAMDLDPKGVNNQIKEAIDKRYATEEDDALSRLTETSEYVFTIHTSNLLTRACTCKHTSPWALTYFLLLVNVKSTCFYVVCPVPEASGEMGEERQSLQALAPEEVDPDLQAIESDESLWWSLGSSET